MALMPVCSGSWTPWRWMTEGAWYSKSSPTLGLDVAEAVEWLAERVDDATEEGVAHRDRQHLTGTPDRLAFLDGGELAENHDADLGDVEVEGQAERAVVELQRSLAMAEGRPSTRAIPSPATATRPTSSRAAAAGWYDFTKASSASRISSGRIVSSVIVAPALCLRLGTSWVHGCSAPELALDVGESAADGAVDDLVFDPRP